MRGVGFKLALLLLASCSEGGQQTAIAPTVVDADVLLDAAPLAELPRDTGPVEPDDIATPADEESGELGSEVLQPDILMLADVDKDLGPDLRPDVQADVQPDLETDLPPDTVAPPAVTSGLVETGRAEAPHDLNGDPHLTEIVLVDGIAYVTNMAKTVATFSLSDDGGVALEAGWPASDTKKPQCSTAVHHAASASLFCTAPYGAAPVPGSVITHMDLAQDPAWPQITADEALILWELSAADLAVVGDSLLIATMDAGLLRAPIGPDGALGEPEQLDLGQRLFRVEPLPAGRIAVLDMDAGVRVAELDGATVVETGQVALEGPPLDLTHAGDRVAVALGSEGAMVFEVDGAGSLGTLAHLQPRCAANGVALHQVDEQVGEQVGESLLVAVACASGVYLYDLTRGTTPIGYRRSTRVFLDAEFAPDGSLLVSDWYDLVRLAVDPEGEVLHVEGPRGRWIRPGDGARFPLRNPGGLTLHVQLAVGGGETPFGEPFTMGPGAEHVVTVDGATLEELVGFGYKVSLGARTDEAMAAGLAHAPDDVVVLGLRIAEEDATAAKALGMPLPGLRVEDVATGEAVELPQADATIRLTSFSNGCSAMWPELLDLAWLQASGRDPEPVAHVLLNDTGQTSGAQAVFAAVWGLDALFHVSSGGEHGHLLEAVGWVYHGPELYQVGLRAPWIPGGASHPTDYVVVDGIIRGIERVYRGRWPLRELVPAAPPTR